MLERKHKRKILSRIPYIFAGLLLITIFLILVSAASYLASSRLKVLSPLAKSLENQGNKRSTLEDQLYKNNIQYSKVEVASDSSYLVFLKDDGVVQVSNNKSLDGQITSLQLILGRLTIEGRKFKKLDLRFNQPIIVF
ncbi:MAG TPA: hypothetical protein VFA93_03225 [Patescibacteria group bacterium]|nr:hypothetical protein [Patescibacteria group bacterium]